MIRPRTAMVLAAGLGTRLRPLTLERPKALVEVAGRALIDHMLDRLVAIGVTRAVVNVHAFADRLEAHLANRRDLEIVISDERTQPLETAGGLKAARGFLGEDPIFVANIDSVWLEPGETGHGRGVAVAEALLRVWDPDKADVTLALAPLERCMGFDGPGDFTAGPDGRLIHRGQAAKAPLAYIGLHLLNPQLIDAWPPGPAGLLPIWLGLTAHGRLTGAVVDALWMHVGDPAALDAAQARLARAAAGERV